MKDKRGEEEKLEKQKKKKDSKALSSKAKGKEKRKRIPPRRLLRSKIILQQKVISKEHSFLNNLSTFSYQGKHPLALSYLLSLRLFLK